VCVNVAADKNFEADVREKVRFDRHILIFTLVNCVCPLAGIPVYSSRGKGNYSNAPTESVAIAAVPGPTQRDVLNQDCGRTVLINFIDASCREKERRPMQYVLELPIGWITCQEVRHAMLFAERSRPF